MICPDVIQVKPREDYTVEVTFQDGKTVYYDVSPLLQKGVFQVLTDKEFFLTHCTIMNHTLAWDLSGRHNPTDCLDIDPYMLYSME